jgi:SSS family solute:Na+ symporter
MAFIFSIIAVILYVVVSLLTEPKPDFNMDKMLHQGQYGDLQDNNRDQPVNQKINWLSHRLGITSEFSKTDKLIYYSSMIYSLALFIILIVVTLLHLGYRFSNKQWTIWWVLDLGFIALTAVVMLFWLLIGGIKDIKYMFSVLKNAIIDNSDDGSVQQ